MKIKYEAEDGKQFNTEKEALEYEKHLKANAELIELLNKILIKLEFVKPAQIDRDNDDYYGGQGPDLRYLTKESQEDKMSSVKLIIETLLSDLKNQPQYLSKTEKLARAYYTSFCNA